MCTNSTPAVWHTPGPAAPDGGYTSPMSAIDVLVLAGVALSAFRGAQRGLMATFLGLAGFAVGAVIGSRLAPVLLQNGRHSPWLGVAGLIGALDRRLDHADRSRSGGERAPRARAPRAAGDDGHRRWRRGGRGARARRRVARRGRGARAAGAPSAPERPELGDPAGTSAGRAGEHGPGRPGALRSAAHRPCHRRPGRSIRPTRPCRERRERTPPRRASSACRARPAGSGFRDRGGSCATGSLSRTPTSSPASTTSRCSRRRAGTYTAVPIAVDGSNDVAILRVHGLPLPRLAIAPKDPSGNAVALIGYPQNGPLTSVPGPGRTAAHGPGAGRVRRQRSAAHRRAAARASSSMVTAAARWSTAEAGSWR